MPGTASDRTASDPTGCGRRIHQLCSGMGPGKLAAGEEDPFSCVLKHALLQSHLANIWSVLTMNSHSCCELYLGMLPSPVEKCGNLISQYKKQGVLANMCLKDPEDMDLECFRGGGSKVFHLTFPPPFIA